MSQSFSPRGRILMMALVFLMSPAASSQEGYGDVFVPNEILVSEPNTYTGIVDPEFDSLAAQFCWIDRLGNLWVGSVDKDTGLLDPPSGQGNLVDTGVVLVGEIGNGPEWAYTDSGPEILYSKHWGRGKALARASVVNGRWIARLVDQGRNRFGPFGSLNAYDAEPTISYVGTTGDGRRPAFVRALNDPSSEQIIPTTDSNPIPGARWVPDRKAVVFVRPTPTDTLAPRQIFLYDMTDRNLQQLTYDAPAKDAVFMWQAPEYNWDYVFFALLDRREIGIYRKLDVAGNGEHEWTRIQTIQPPPSAGEFIWSPEPFVFDGRSYIVMVTSTSEDQRSVTVPTEIWLAGIDPVEPLFRRLSDGEELVRKDPEVFFADAQPYIYSTVTDGPFQTIHRLDTGLETPSDNAIASPTYPPATSHDNP